MESQAARNLLEVDRRTAADMLDAAEGWARDAITEVRRVVYGLRPPVLDQLGLARALEEHAANINASSDGAPITVEVSIAGEVDGLPAAVEVAAYLIALEGVTNVLRHAAARHCEIHIQASGLRRVEVVDDGTGVADEHAIGVGLTSMRERAEELGGSFSVGAARPHGTRVVAEIPLGGGVSEREIIRVLVADDHPIVRQGLRTLLASLPMFEVVAEASEGAEAVALALEEQPDVVVMDLHSPASTG